MSRRIAHLVVTKYNLSVYSDPRFRLQTGVSPDAWMSERYRLFRSFTVPSLAGQSCQDFRWAVLLDRHTPREFVRQLEEIAEQYRNLEVVFLEGRQVDFLRARAAGSGAEVVITSRIDSDDAWHRDYVRYLQEAGLRPGTLVDFQDSYWLDLQQRRLFLCRPGWWHRVRAWRSSFSPPVSNSPSAVERPADARTVMADQHPRLVRAFGRRNLVRVRGLPYRLITCHGGNLLNQLAVAAAQGRLTEVPLGALADFNVVLEGEPPPSGPTPGDRPSSVR